MNDHYCEMQIMVININGWGQKQWCIHLTLKAVLLSVPILGGSHMDFVLFTQPPTPIIEDQDFLGCVVGGLPRMWVFQC